MKPLWRDVGAYLNSAETKIAFHPDTFQQSAGMFRVITTIIPKTKTTLQISLNEEKGKILELMSCDNFTFDMPLKGKEIVIPKKKWNMFDES